jgi:hypothetical protein
MLHSVKCILKWRLRIDFNENKNCHHVGAIPNPIEKNHGKGQISTRQFNFLASNRNFNKMWRGKTSFVRCCIYLTTYDWIKSFLKITIECRAIYGNLENKINTLYWPVENSIHKNNDANDR